MALRSRATLDGVTVEPAGVVAVMKAIAKANGTSLSVEITNACKAYITAQATAKGWDQEDHPNFFGYGRHSAVGLLPAPGGGDG